jgi:hypothetical protein
MVAPLVFALAATMPHMAICTWTIWILQTMLALVMFTKGQKQKMRALFEPGGARASILSSGALGSPVSEEISLQILLHGGSMSKFILIRLPPELNINVESDTRWVGNELQVINITGAAAAQKNNHFKNPETGYQPTETGTLFYPRRKTRREDHGKVYKTLILVIRD